MSMENTFNPNSSDAMFAKVLQRLDTQDETLQRIEQNTSSGLGSLGNRVGALERERWYQRGITAAIATVCIGIWEWITRK